VRDVRDLVSTHINGGNRPGTRLPTNGVVWTDASGLDRFTTLLDYKAEAEGIHVGSISERDTSENRLAGTERAGRVTETSTFKHLPTSRADG